MEISMNKKFKQIRNIIMVILFSLGIGILMLTQVVELNNLTEWKELITFTVWIYLTLVWIYILVLNAIPLVWNHFKRK